MMSAYVPTPMGRRTLDMLSDRPPVMLARLVKMNETFWLLTAPLGYVVFNCAPTTAVLLCTRAPAMLKLAGNAIEKLVKLPVLGSVKFTVMLATAPAVVVLVLFMYGADRSAAPVSPAKTIIAKAAYSQL